MIVKKLKINAFISAKMVEIKVSFTSKQGRTAWTILTKTIPIYSKLRATNFVILKPLW